MSRPLPIARVVVLLASIVAAAVALRAQGHDVVVPYIPPPQDNAALQDRVTRLARQIESGAVRLEPEPVGGMLAPVLRALDVPVSSQVLVFSKTSLQYQYISPRTPRAIYFNDDTYIGFVPDGTLLEISAVDPQAGAIFYTIGQRAGGRPRLVTDARCLQCHQIPATLGIAGHFMRSTFVRSDGTLASGEPSFVTDDRSPFAERWGGWFVSGTVSGNLHMGNALLPLSDHAATFDRQPGSTVTDVSRLFNHERYLSSESDVVALMVLGHQLRVHNLIARLHHDITAGAPGTDVAEDTEALVRGLLFVDEAPLTGPIAGPTTFRADFEQRGPADPRGRSLRQFDLETRLFRYPCSYLIYSEAFLALPAAAKTAIYARLDAVLSGRDTSDAFKHLQAADRAAIRDILTATHHEFANATDGSS